MLWRRIEPDAITRRSRLLRRDDDGEGGAVEEGTEVGRIPQVGPPGSCVICASTMTEQPNA